MPFHEWYEDQLDKIVEMCESDWEISKDESEVLSRFRMPHKTHYECGLHQFYALHKVLDIMVSLEEGSEDLKVFKELEDRYYDEEFDTYDYKSIHLEFEEYMRNK
jgi:hypothetical protein